MVGSVPWAVQEGGREAVGLIGHIAYAFGPGIRVFRPFGNHVREVDRCAVSGVSHQSEPVLIKLSKDLHIQIVEGFYVSPLKCCSAGQS